MVDNLTKYAWYVERNRIAIVEKDNGKWVSIKDADKKMRVHATAIPTSSSSEAVGLSGFFNGEVEWQLVDCAAIPKQFHEALVFKAIALGYQKPPTINPQLSEFFTAQYLDAIKRAKTYVKAQGIATGFISPQDY